MSPFTDGIRVFSPAGDCVSGRGGNYSSQFGEDGLIAAALERFGSTNRWCFEVGAADGFLLSNTALLREKGWTAILIEGAAASYVHLQHIASERIFTVPEFINERSLDQILRRLSAPADLDLGVIDIDGQDYWAWEGMRDFAPRLMLVEFEYSSEDKPEWAPECRGAGQANYQAILRLGADKGYLPLAKTHCNLLFCRKDVAA